MVDVAIIGAGPAGVAAALNVRVRNLSLLLIGARASSDKLRSAHAIHNYPGFATIGGQSLANAYQSHLAAEHIDVLLHNIDHIYPMGDYFVITSGDDNWEACTVVLATGVSFEHPLPGEEALVGQGVSYCATCDGRLYKGKHVLVLGYDEKAAEEAVYLSGLARVTYIPLTKSANTDAPELDILGGVKPVSLARRDGKTVLHTDTGELEADCVFILRSAIAPNLLVSGLQTENGHVHVNRDYSTNIAGLFAAGDVTGTPYQVAKAVGEGATAGLSAVSYVAAHRKRAD